MGSLVLDLGQRSTVAIALPSSNGYLGRTKQGKGMVLPSKDRERSCLRCLRAIVSRKMGMLAAAIISFLSLVMLTNFTGFLSSPPPLPPEGIDILLEVNKNLQIYSPSNNANSAQTGVPVSNGSLDPPPVSFEDRHGHSVPLIKSRSLPPGHPCEGFNLPPPPADKKRTGPRPCPVCYLQVEEAIQKMPSLDSSATAVLKKLSYVVELADTDLGLRTQVSEFGGHPSLEDREKSFQIQENMNVHCGFVKGNEPGVGTGFDIHESDRMEMNKCTGVVVASAIFGNYDRLQQPRNISRHARHSVCFFMFVDEETHQSLDMDYVKRGLWKVVVVYNLPYSDARRNGKIPKLLLHRLFPQARYSLWVDGKLELVVDPYQVLERFLWRYNQTFAISRHYKRFDVFEEAQANKAARKYDNSSIDAQVEFYRKEGLVPYKELTSPFLSDVPEGCVIIREHTPITNLFTCLWFNEVDRFTSRDQLSFAMVRNKLLDSILWWPGMFLDCERRNFVVQAYHRDLLEHRKALLSTNISTEHTSPTSNPQMDIAIGIPASNRLTSNPEHLERHTPPIPRRKVSARRRRAPTVRHRRSSRTLDNKPA